MSSVKSYFDSHAHNTAYHKESGFYLSLAEHIPHENNVIMLDIGCGNGNFIKAMIDTGIKGRFVGMDISSKMLLTAKQNLDSFIVDLCLADAFKIPFRASQKFEVIHIDSVLHHLIGKTRGKSFKMIRQLVSILTEKLSANGVLIIEEFYYNSYVIESISSFIIFHALKLLNFFKLNASNIIKDIQPGLEVNFLTVDQLHRLFDDYAYEVKVIRKTTSPKNKIKRIFLVKEYGNISMIAVRREK